MISWGWWGGRGPRFDLRPHPIDSHKQLLYGDTGLFVSRHKLWKFPTQDGSAKSGETVVFSKDAVTLLSSCATENLDGELQI